MLCSFLSADKSIEHGNAWLRGTLCVIALRAIDLFEFLLLALSILCFVERLF
jgi:hypothetical protein